MIIELHFNSINSKNYKQINRKVYDIFSNSGNYEKQVEFQDKNDGIDFTFSDISSGNYINYSFYNNEGQISTEGNNDFVIELIEILLPELFREYKIGCIFFVEAVEGIEDIEDFFRKKEKFIVEKVHDYRVSISYELIKKINDEEIERTFKFYEFKKILENFKKQIKREFLLSEFIATILGIGGIISVFFTSEFKDKFGINGNYIKYLLFFIISVAFLYLTKGFFFSLKDYICRFWNKNIPFSDPENETKRIYLNK